MKALRYIIPSIAVVLLAAVAGRAIDPGTMILRNGTKSMPLGFYVRDPSGEPTTGAVIAFRPPAIALAHGWPADIPMLKRVVAVGGDKVCTDGGVLAVNDVWLGLVLDRLPNSRPLPVWKDCRVLQADEVFPFATGLPDSFDGRAYGPVNVSDLVGVFVPVWTWEAF
jgi:type IV secretory pathway protease TraF